MELLCWPDALCAEARADIGGKAAGLLRLQAAGARVPKWAVLPAEIARGRPWRTDPGAVEMLQDCFTKLNATGGAGVAVRSSALAEDQAAASCAGVYETVFVNEAGALQNAIEQVLDSAQSESATEYARAGGSPMAVVLQSVVVPRHAGVCFSAHPARAHPERCCIEAVCGAGAGLVDGSKTPSTFEVRFPDGGAVAAEPGPDGPQAFSAEVVAALLEVLAVLEQDLGGPVDIEWAEDEAGLWFLQARPVTRLAADPALRPRECCTSWFFDQRFLEPITPITRTTLLVRVARIAIVDALHMRGVSPPEPLLRFYGGQAYVPHAAYRAMLRGAPRWWLSEDLRQLFPRQCCCEKDAARPLAVFHYAWCALAAVCKNRAEVFGNIPAWRRFQAELAEFLKTCPEARPASPDEWRLRWEALDAWTDRFLRLHRWSILWANYVYRLFLLLSKPLPRAWARRLNNRLRQAVRLPTAEANRALAEYLAADSSEQAEIRPGLAARFGHRSPSLDYAAPTWAEMVAGGTLPNACAGSGQAPCSETARWSPAPAPLRPLVRLLEMREEQRFQWERILARQRKLLLWAGGRLEAEGLLAECEDVWFLTWDELAAALFEHRQPRPRTIALRKHAHAVENAIPTPPFIGPEPPSPAAAAAGTRLHGTGASGGAAQGRLVVCQDPHRVGASGTDAILVMPSLDPGHTLLLGSVRGIVLERGGLLSHGAILAREYGVPMVVGVEAATRRLRTGQTATVNGDTGEVRIDGAGAES
mgnify:CR=1 FL=1